MEHRPNFQGLNVKKNLKYKKNSELFTWGFGRDHKEPKIWKNLTLHNLKSQFCCTTISTCQVLSGFNIGCF
jgi:hypothetical protein